MLKGAAAGKGVAMHPGSRRSTGISGIVFVVLGVVVVVLSGENDFTQTDGALRGYFVDDARQQQAVAAMLILPLALAALLWFTAGLRTLLQADAGSGLPSAAALGGGFFAATFLVGVTVSNSVAVALAFMDRYAFDPHEARLTLLLGIVLTTGALTGAAVMITATSLAGRRLGLLPAWFTRASHVVAVLALFSLLLFGWPYALVAVWFLTLSILLLRSPAEGGREMPSPRPDQEALQAEPQQSPTGPNVTE
jgi:hypothetical protein